MMHEFLSNNMLKDCQPKNDEISHETYIPEPSRCFNSIYYDDDDDKESTIPLNEIFSQIPPSIAITPVLPIVDSEDSLIMVDENLSTIPEKESDEFIKSSVENLVPIPIDGTSHYLRRCSGGLFLNYAIHSFDYDDEDISSDVNPLFNEMLKDIENKDSYVSNLAEPALLVTILSKLNEDECFDPGGKFDEIEACLTSDSIPPGIDGAEFDPKGDILLLEKLLNDYPSSPLPLNKLNFEELKVIKSNVSTDIEDNYYDSEGDIIYLESLLIKDTTHNLPPEVFLDHDPRSLKDEPDNDELMSMVKVFDPGIYEKFISSTYVRIAPDYEDSRAHGFVHRSLELLSFAYPFIEIPSGESKVHIEVLSVLWRNRLLDHGRIALLNGQVVNAHRT
ncbi:hypothetical protein Tco_1123039 [Tanacetum coccineum]|uniref:Reverse transcriptase domain-containing protein n=1 Tax=Tanacetum coccineum TaxID=301880 RepID=A0ABQ5J281_9ASTR